MPTGPEPSLTPEKLRQGWLPRRVGRRILVLPETTSTNAAALDAADRLQEGREAGEARGPDVDGLVVLADYQTAGRGRQGRRWLSPRGASVLCSVLLMQEGQDMAGVLTLASAVAACDAIRSATTVTPAIKWPNDLRVSGRKLGGILVESRHVRTDRSADGHRSDGVAPRAWVVGIGINCLQQTGHFPPELRGLATSLELETSHPVDRVKVARELLRSLDRWLAKPARPGDGAIHAAWMDYVEPIGQRVRLLCRGREYTGRTVAIDPVGGLIVQADGGRQEWFDPMLTTLL